mgnify:CR=1 FL=1
MTFSAGLRKTAVRLARQHKHGRDCVREFPVVVPLFQTEWKKNRDSSQSCYRSFVEQRTRMGSLRNELNRHGGSPKKLLAHWGIAPQFRVIRGQSFSEPAKDIAHLRLLTRTLSRSEIALGIQRMSEQYGVGRVSSNILGLYSQRYHQCTAQFIAWHFKFGLPLQGFAEVRDYHVQEGFDLNLTWDQAVRKAQKWHQEVSLGTDFYIPDSIRTGILAAFGRDPSLMARTLRSNGFIFTYGGGQTALSGWALSGDPERRAKDGGRFHYLECDGHDFELLLTAEQYREEGAQMVHCVPTYFREAQRGECFIYRVKRDAVHVGTLETAPSGDVIQFKAEHNSMPDDRAISAAAQFVARLCLNPKDPDADLSDEPEFMMRAVHAYRIMHNRSFGRFDRADFETVAAGFEAATVAVEELQGGLETLGQALEEWTVRIGRDTSIEVGDIVPCQGHRALVTEKLIDPPTRPNRPCSAAVTLESIGAEPVRRACQQILANVEESILGSAPQADTALSRVMDTLED